MIPGDPEAADLAEERRARRLGGDGDPEAVPALVALMDHRGPWVRAAAAEALGRLGDPAAAPVLVPALADAHYWVRGRAAQSLGLLGDPEAIPPLIDGLTDPGRAHPWMATALGELRAGEAVPTLVRSAVTGGPALRLHAVRALARLPDPVACEALSACLRDDDPEIRFGAAVALQALADCCPGRYLQQVLPDLRRRLHLMSDELPHVRECCARLLLAIAIAVDTVEARLPIPAHDPQASRDTLPLPSRCPPGRDAPAQPAGDGSPAPGP